MQTELVESGQKASGNDTFATLSGAVASRTATVTVIGQGYVGLPLAVAFAGKGFRVTGLDVNKERVDSLNRGLSSTPDVPTRELREVMEKGRYQASMDYSLLRESDVILICVPTPLRKSKDPDISFVLDSAERVAEHLRPGQLIILESTTYPGTTEELLLPLFRAKGFKPGEDFFLAFSPERIDPGNQRFRVSDIPKVTGGITSRCTQLAADFYRQIVGRVVEVSSPKVAELSKLYENVFRSVNIALANEFALMCGKLDVNTREVIDAAASKPFGFMPFYPGPGIGGHCIPIDPFYLAWKMKFSNFQGHFIPLAEEINQAMPKHVERLVIDALNRRRRCLNGARILILGAAYKRNVGDTRESPALQIMASLLAGGADLAYTDPHVSSIEVGGATLRSKLFSDADLERADCVLILTDHEAFDYRRILEHASLVVDTRGATHGLDAGAGQVIGL